MDMERKEKKKGKGMEKSTQVRMNKKKMNKKRMSSGVLDWKKMPKKK